MSPLFLLYNLCIITSAFSNSILSTYYGGEDGSPYTALDQGRINHIEWGYYPQETGTPHSGAIVFTNWISDRQTIQFPSIPLTLIPCKSFTLSTYDFITGFKIYYDLNYIFGLEFYTLQGNTYSCYHNETIINKESSIVSPDFLYIGNEDFYYLSGFDAMIGAVCDGIQFQFSHIADSSQPLIQYLPNSAFSATSYHHSTPSCIPSCAKLVSENGCTAWCSADATNVTRDHLEIDFGRMVKIFSITTANRAGTTYNNQYVTTYTISYSPNGKIWTTYNNNEVLLGPRNDSNITEINHVLSSPIIMQCIRFYPVTWNVHKSMRVEAYGYDWVVVPTYSRKLCDYYHQDPISTSISNQVGTIKVGQETSLEFYLYVHTECAASGLWCDFLRIGPESSSDIRLPGLWQHGDGGWRIYWSKNDDDSYQANIPSDESYSGPDDKEHLWRLTMTQTMLEVYIDDILYVSKIGNFTTINHEEYPIWIGDSINAIANATLRDICIISNAVTHDPTQSPTMEPTYNPTMDSNNVFTTIHPNPSQSPTNAPTIRPSMDPTEVSKSPAMRSTACNGIYILYVTKSG